MQRRGLRVVLVDLDLHLGDVLSFLDVAGTYSITDVLANMNRLDRDLLATSVTKHRSGISVLAQSSKVEEAEQIKAQDVSALLEFLRRNYDFVIVDGVRGFDELSLAALDGSQHVFLALTQDVPAVRNGQRCLELFGRLQYDQQRIKILLNRYQKASKITVEVVSETLGQPLTHTISNDFILLIDAINRGRVARRCGAAREDYPGRRGARSRTCCRSARRACAARACSGRCSARRSPMGLRDRLSKRPEPATGSHATGTHATPTRQVVQLPGAGNADSYHELKHELHQKLIEKIDLATIEKLPREQLRDELRLILNQILAVSDLPLNRVEREQMVEELLDEVTGLGPLEPLLADTTISDIMVNGYATCYIERFGKLELTPIRFRDNAHLQQIIVRIVSRVGRRIDESSPMADARLPDGARVNAIIPPLAIDGPVLSIRRFGGSPLRVKDMIAINSATPEMLAFLAACVKAKLNCLISGGTGTGKTTMLNALSSFIPENERVLTIEDAAELQLQQRHVVRLETRPPNIEGKGEVLARDLVKNALRMRPDRIVIGECRGGEVLDMLQAMNTGHEGSMTTVHANTPRDALSRVEAMVGMGGIQMSEALIRQTIARSLNVIIQLSRGTDGKRRITSIAEITGHPGGRDHDAGDLQVRAAGRRRRRQDHRRLPVHRHPAARARSHRALRHQPRRDHQAVPVRPRTVKFIVIGVVGLTAVVLLEALVYTMRYLSDRRKRRAEAPAVGAGQRRRRAAAGGRAAHGQAGRQPGHRCAASIDEGRGAAGGAPRADRAGNHRRAAARLHGHRRAARLHARRHRPGRHHVPDPGRAVRPAAAVLRHVQAQPAQRASCRSSCPTRWR